MGKIVFRDTCEAKLTWDEQLQGKLLKHWKAWITSLPERIGVPRSLAFSREEICAIDLHGFGDASGKGTCAAVYAHVIQPSVSSQGLITSKSRLSKKGVTIPRLELISGHMTANLLENVKEALKHLPIRACYGWLDSAVALYWIQGQGSYKQFVANRIGKIRQKEFIVWKHVASEENPADIGSRGCHGSKVPPIWFQGPEWLKEKGLWPPELIAKSSIESEAEAQPVKEIFKASLQERDTFDTVLERNEYWKAMRVTSWVKRFITNARKRKRERVEGPLTTNEIESTVTWWIKRVQQNAKGTHTYKNDELMLNLQKNTDGLLECRGRVQGLYPIYLPAESLFTERLVMHCHKSTLHGGVIQTMTEVRENYWIPRLRQLVKRLRFNCRGCKKFQAIAFNSPSPGYLPKDRTEGSRPFDVIGVDYAGPIAYKENQRSTGKAYILLFTCSLTRAVYIELTKDMTTEQFMLCLKALIARRGWPSKIYSDNAKTFVAASKAIKKMMKSEELTNYLAKNKIQWQFNLSKAPWWGGQYERIVGLVKQALFKVVEAASLKFQELKEVLLDVEISLNNRPLG